MEVDGLVNPQTFVETGLKTFSFQYPLTLELDITRGNFQSLAEGIFRITNLSLDTRNALYQNWNDQVTLPRYVKVWAGYQSWLSATDSYQTLPLIFSGQMKKCESFRSGTDWITQVEAWDGGQSNAQSDISIGLTASSFSVIGVIEKLAQSLGVNIGYISPALVYKAARGYSFVGRALDALHDLSWALNADAFIDLGKLYVVPKGQGISGLGSIVTLDSSFGIISSPIKQQNNIDIELVFEPRIVVGQVINLNSLQSVVNGQYVVSGVSHVGTISGAVGGDLRTKISCVFPQVYA